MADINPQQLLDDALYVQNIIANRLLVVDPAVPDRRAAVTAILERLEAREGRRGGPRRQDLWVLSDLCPGEAGVPQAANKSQLVQDLLARIRQPDGGQAGPVPAVRVAPPVLSHYNG